MPRRPTRRSPEPPEAAPPSTRIRARPRGLLQKPVAIPSDMKADIIANWNLPSNNINTCVPAELWPLNEPDPEKWHIDIVRLIHEASESSKGNNALFWRGLQTDIRWRQLKNRSKAGKVGWMTVTDLKKVCQRFQGMKTEIEENKGKSEQKGKDTKKEEAAQTQDGAKPIRRGRSNGAPADPPPSRKRKKSPAPARGKANPQKEEAEKRQEADIENSPAEKPTTKPSSKRSLPIRSARNRRNLKSPKPSRPKIPPPVTPANPPEDSASEASEQENTPPEPVSGRHIYGDFIKPTTIAFPTASPSAEDLAAAVPGKRTTRKRARAAAESTEGPPQEVQIDSDPRDIDATGFLSELDPREARRRRKPRLSRLESAPGDEPAWSQDVAVLETPALTPTSGEMAAGTPAAPCFGGDVGQDGEEEILEIEMLTNLLPRIPECATVEERGGLEERIRLIHRDIGAYKRCVAGINERDIG